MPEQRSSFVEAQNVIDLVTKTPIVHILLRPVAMVGKWIKIVAKVNVLAVIHSDFRSNSAIEDLALSGIFP